MRLPNRDKFGNWHYHPHFSYIDTLKENAWTRKVSRWWLNNRYVKRKPISEDLERRGIQQKTYEQTPVGYVCRGSREFNEYDLHQYWQYLKYYFDIDVK